MKTRFFALAALAGAGVQPDPALAGPLTLAADGKSAYVILVGPQADRTERYAADELQKYLAQMTGAKLPVVTEAGEAPFLAVGEVAATQAVTVPARYEGDDGFRIRTLGRNVALKGANGRGTLYAVYAFLERLGCWWFTPGTPALQPHHEHVPHRPTLAVEPLDALEQPLLKYRKQDGDLPLLNQNLVGATWPRLLEWMGKNKRNTLAIGMREYEKVRDHLKDELALRGMRLEVGKHDVTHELLSPEKYFGEHPDWFGMVGGKRAVKEGSRPVTFETANPEAVATFERNLIDYLKRRPEIDVFQLWPPDSCVWSESPEGKALGEPAERMALLVQHVARAVREAGLKTRIAFPAYASYIQPPRNMDFPKDALVDFCPINQNYGMPLDDARDPKNVKLNQHLRNWAARFPGEISHYTYYAKYSWYSFPVASHEQIAHELQYDRGIGVVGASMYCETINWLALEVNHLSFAQASWNPDFDARAWFDAYLAARFGAAADAMRRYYGAATRVSLGALIPESAAGEVGGYAPLVSEARAAMGEAGERADTPMAKWLVAKLSWQPDYLDAALRLRQAVVAKASPEEIRPLQEAVRRLVDAHADDGTYLHVDWFYR